MVYLYDRPFSPLVFHIHFPYSRRDGRDYPNSWVRFFAIYLGIILNTNCIDIWKATKKFKHLKI